MNLKGLFLGGSLLVGAFLAGNLRAQTGSIVARKTENLFRTELGRSDPEVRQKLDAAWQQLFYGNALNERLYYLAAPNLAYVTDTGNHDVRTEGMSYAMMIAVQTDHREEFDRLWRWVKKYMYHPNGPKAGYFAWHCTYQGRPLDSGPAPDGEEWFTMALFFAAERWRSQPASFNYHAEAAAILQAMLGEVNRAAPAAGPMFNREWQEVVFTPDSKGSQFTDPSYHLPAFYALWSLYDPRHGEFWRKTAARSREFFKKAANSQTGLMPDYANFDGTPHVSRGHEDFRFDAWRTMSNVALDYAWFEQDPWAKRQSNRVLTFLRSQGPHCPNQFTLEGKPLSRDVSPGLFAMAAVGGLAADSEVGRPFVQQLWDAPIPRGPYRYYDGMLYYLALLEVSGELKAYVPAVPIMPNPSAAESGIPREFETK